MDCISKSKKHDHVSTVVKHGCFFFNNITEKKLLKYDQKFKDNIRVMNVIVYYILMRVSKSHYPQTEKCPRKLGESI